MSQESLRMPRTGEAWRHYKGTLYTIVGLARNEDGFAYVVYTEYRWNLVQASLLYTQPLGRFVQDVENGKPRFKFNAPRGDDPDCQFINERTNTGA